MVAHHSVMQPHKHRVISVVVSRQVLDYIKPRAGGLCLSVVGHCLQLLLHLWWMGLIKWVKGHGVAMHYNSNNTIRNAA